ncbi:MAG: prenyltransferase, partial [Bacteroidetes bacterium SW_11_45_7]
MHLRFPFSVFLLPIYIFAISQVQAISTLEAILIFIILHLFIYPASNAYNSYMDQDEGSIGSVKNPPKAGLNVYCASILFDSAGLVLALLTNWHVFFLLIPYILASKAYSWRGIRLKKEPIAGWLTVIL